MPDAIFEHPRLVAVYDALDADRSDLDVYVDLVHGLGARRVLVETWTEVTDVSLPLVTFRSTWVFASDGAVLTSDSTLRFREREEVVASLAAHGFTTSDVRGAPDRPGRELVFIARTG